MRVSVGSGCCAVEEIAPLENEVVGSNQEPGAVFLSFNPERNLIIGFIAKSDSSKWFFGIIKISSNKFGKICAIFVQIWLHFWPKWAFFIIYLAKTPLWAKFCRFRLVCLNERKQENLFWCFLLAGKHEFQGNFFFTVKGPFWGDTWLILLDKTCA